MSFSCKRNFDRLSKEENKYNLTTASDLKEVAYSQQIEDFCLATKIFNDFIVRQIFRHIKDQWNNVVVIS